MAELGDSTTIPGLDSGWNLSQPFRLGRPQEIFTLNWRNVSTQLAWETDIKASEQNGEQRRILQARPTTSLSFECLANGELELHALKNMMVKMKQASFCFPLLSDPMPYEGFIGTAGPTDQTILNFAPGVLDGIRGLYPGNWLYIVSRQIAGQSRSIKSDVVEIISSTATQLVVQGTILDFYTPNDITCMFPCMICEMNTEAQLQLLTETKGVASITINERLTNKAVGTIDPARYTTLYGEEPVEYWVDHENDPSLLLAENDTSDTSADSFEPMDGDIGDSYLIRVTLDEPTAIFGVTALFNLAGNISVRAVVRDDQGLGNPPGALRTDFYSEGELIVSGRNVATLRLLDCFLPAGSYWFGFELTAVGGATDYLEKLSDLQYESGFVTTSLGSGTETTNLYRIGVLQAFNPIPIMDMKQDWSAPPTNEPYLDTTFTESGRDQVGDTYGWSDDIYSGAVVSEDRVDLLKKLYFFDLIRGRGRSFAKHYPLQQGKILEQPTGFELLMDWDGEYPGTFNPPFAFMFETARHVGGLIFIFVNGVRYIRRIRLSVFADLVGTEIVYRLDLDERLPLFNLNDIDCVYYGGLCRLTEDTLEVEHLNTQIGRFQYSYLSRHLERPSTNDASGLRSNLIPTLWDDPELDAESSSLKGLWGLNTLSDSPGTGNDLPNEIAPYEPTQMLRNFDDVTYSDGLAFIVNNTGAVPGPYELFLINGPMEQQLFIEDEEYTFCFWIRNVGSVENVIVEFNTGGNNLIFRARSGFFAIQIGAAVLEGDTVIDNSRNYHVALRVSKRASGNWLLTTIINGVLDDKLTLQLFLTFSNPTPTFIFDASFVFLSQIVNWCKPIRTQTLQRLSNARIRTLPDGTPRTLPLGGDRSLPISGRRYYRP